MLVLGPEITASDALVTKTSREQPPFSVCF